jgi:hypothetical protein
MIPCREIDPLLVAIDEAGQWANQGLPGRGLAVLQNGLHRALACQQHGERWAAELVEEYRNALWRYCVRQESSEKRCRAVAC